MSVRRLDHESTIHYLQRLGRLSGVKQVLPGVELMKRSGFTVSDELYATRHRLHRN